MRLFSPRIFPLLAALTMGIGCGPVVMNTTPESHDRVIFESPTQTVQFVYQNLESGRYRDIGEAFLAYRDRRPWIGQAEGGQAHPWVNDPMARWRISGLHERAPGEAVVTVEERWSDGGWHERRFLVFWTTDGWRIASVDGVPGDGVPSP